MILAKKEIIKEIKKGRIKITKLNKKDIGPASVDLTLDSKIRIFAGKNKEVKVTKKTDYKSITKTVKIKKEYKLKPGELILGITKEKITLPEDICGWLNSRSRFARLGLMVHITAPFVQPGISNKQVLEIYNASPNNLIIKPGEKLCQFVFQRCEGKAKYKGIFKKQEI